MLFEQLLFTLDAGEALLVSGANGAGKSSLIRVAAGLLAPVAGHVRTAGQCALLAEAAAFDAERVVAAVARRLRSPVGVNYDGR